jgi:hypothetical protein
MSTPDRSDPSLQGGVRKDIAMGVTGPDAAALGAAQAAAESRDMGRRQAGNRYPGSGTEMSIPQVPYGPSVGKIGADFPAVGLGYEQAPSPPSPPWQVASYDSDHAGPLPAHPGQLAAGLPVLYPGAEVGGYGFAVAAGQPATAGVRASSIADMANYAFATADRAGYGERVTIISPDIPAAAAPRKPGIISRVLGKLRRK